VEGMDTMDSVAFLGWNSSSSEDLSILFNDAELSSVVSQLMKSLKSSFQL